MLIKGNLLQKHQCCSGSVQLCISSLLNRSTSTSAGNNCLVGKDGKEELRLKRERKKNKNLKWFCCKWDGTCEWDVSGDWQEFWLWRNLGEQFWRGKCCGVFPQKSQYHLTCGLIKKHAKLNSSDPDHFALHSSQGTPKITNTMLWGQGVHR